MYRKLKVDFFSGFGPSLLMFLVSIFLMLICEYALPLLEYSDFYVILELILKTLIVTLMYWFALVTIDRLNAHFQQSVFVERRIFFMLIPPALAVFPLCIASFYYSFKEWPSDLMIWCAIACACVFTTACNYWVLKRIEIFDGGVVQYNSFSKSASLHLSFRTNYILAHGGRHLPLNVSKEIEGLIVNGLPCLRSNTDLLIIESQLLTPKRIRELKTLMKQFPEWHLSVDRRVNVVKSYFITLTMMITLIKRLKFKHHHQLIFSKNHGLTS